MFWSVKFEEKYLIKSWGLQAYLSRSQLILLELNKNGLSLLTYLAKPSKKLLKREQ